MSSYLGEKPHPLGSLRQRGSSLPPISKAPVFVVVSEGIPEAERHAHIVHHVSGTFQQLEGVGEGGGTGRGEGSEGNGSWGSCMPSRGGVSSLLGPTAWGLEGQLVSPSVCPRTPESPNKSWPGQKRLQRADSHGSDAISQGAHPCSQLYLPIRCFPALGLLVSLASSFFSSGSSHLSKAPPLSQLQGFPLLGAMLHKMPQASAQTNTKGWGPLPWGGLSSGLSQGSVLFSCLYSNFKGLP